MRGAYGLKIAAGTAGGLVHLTILAAFWSCRGAFLRMADSFDWVRTVSTGDLEVFRWGFLTEGRTKTAALAALGQQPAMIHREKDAPLYPVLVQNYRCLLGPVERAAKSGDWGRGAGLAEKRDTHCDRVANDQKKPLACRLALSATRVRDGAGRVAASGAWLVDLMANWGFCAARLVWPLLLVDLELTRLAEARFFGVKQTVEIQG